MEDRTAKALKSDVFDDTVEVIVGTDPRRKKFTLHKGILCHYSAYFKAALDGNFKEANSKAIEPPDEEVKMFERFVLWLYSKMFFDDGTETYTTICDLYIFADRRQIPDLKNQMINALRDKNVKIWKSPTKNVKSIYENTTRGCGLRRLVIEIIVRFGDPSQTMTEANRSDWPEDALFDMVKATWLKNTGTKNQLIEMHMCKYHDHEPGVTCETQKS